MACRSSCSISRRKVTSSARSRASRSAPGSPTPPARHMARPLRSRRIDGVETTECYSIVARPCEVIPMSIEEIVLEAEERMEKSITLLHDQFRGVRTGRANVGLVDSIRVEYYGSATPLKQLANLSTPEPQQILIRPFDQTVVG